ncbi:MAG: ATP-dependent RecD-like DNA helicase [Desulfotomaculales bacterium]
MGSPQAAKNIEAETISGAVARVRFHNPANGYCVLSIDAGEEFVTAVGYMPSIREGDEYSFSGRWTNHPKFGRQFAFSEYELLLPKSRQGIISYLSTLAHGVGPAKAAKIVDALGEDCLDLIREKPELLYSVQGITPDQAGEIIQKLNENVVLSEFSSLICRQGITPRLAAKIYSQYGKDSVSVVKENPYVLADEMYGVGFITADKIAQAVGIALDSPYRVRAAVEYALKEAAENEGHCYLRPRDIVPAVQKLLGKGCGVGVDEIAQACEKLISAGKIVREGPCVYLSRMHEAEKSLAADMRRLLKREITVEADWDKLIALAERVAGMEYSVNQKEAVKTALASPLSVITGGPGTGKTTVTQGILVIYNRLYPDNKIYLASPTGRAAKRLAEVTGCEAKTIHRLLEYHPEFGFQRDALNQLDGPGLLIVDEVSMVDVELAAELFEAVPDDLQVVMVGDVDQLPSVDPGSVLRDAILSGAVPAVRLEYNYRQARGSRIALHADFIRRGKIPPLENSPDVEYVFCGGAEEAAELVIDRVRQALEDGYAVNDFQVLTPQRKGPAGTKALNEALRELVNPPGEKKKEFNAGQKIFRVGDKVMVTRRNLYDLGVYNGDIGIVIDVEPGPKETSIGGETINLAPGIWVKFDDEQEPVFFSIDNKGRNDLDYLELAYASTVHKAQGSEFPLVIAVCVKNHYIMLQRNLLYTAYTRAKSRLIVVCQPDAVEIAVRNDRIQERYSRLRERLVEKDGD